MYISNIVDGIKRNKYDNLQSEFQQVHAEEGGSD